LAGEPVAREIQRADTESGAQRPGHVEPVDAAGGPAVDEQQHRSARVAELDVENLNRHGVFRRRLPGEIATTTSPVLSPRSGHDPGPSGWLPGPAVPWTSTVTVPEPAGNCFPCQPAEGQPARSAR